MNERIEDHSTHAKKAKAERESPERLLAAHEADSVHQPKECEQHHKCAMHIGPVLCGADSDGEHCGPGNSDTERNILDIIASNAIPARCG